MRQMPIRRRSQERTHDVALALQTTPPGLDSHDLADTALADLVARGDAAALEELYGRYGPACYRLAIRVLGSSSGAEDVVQEVFVSLWQARARYDPTRGRLDSWLLTLTHHKAVDAVRREAPHSRRRAAGELGDVLLAAVDPADDAWVVERQQRVRGALHRLPATQREAVVLAYFGGYTHQEIARLTDAPVGTVKTRLLAAMRRLRDDLVRHGVLVGDERS